MTTRTGEPRPKVVNEEADALWASWVVDPSPQTKKLLVEKYLPLVQRVSGKMWRNLPRQVELDDVVQYGSLGLLRAIEHFDPLSGVNFETYAVASIRGLILDELRAADWAPRSLRRKQRDIARVERDISAEQGRGARACEVAEKLGITEDEVRAVRRSVEAARMRSLDELSDDGEGTSRYEQVEDEKTPDPETERSRKDVYSSLLGVIGQFSLQDQLLLALHYYEEFTLAECGRVLGIPESRASAIHTRTMMVVREQMLLLFA